MTSSEFNEKWKSHIEVGYSGLEFDIPIVTDYLDYVFEYLVKIGNFKISQIKLKFNRTMIYSNLREEYTWLIEMGMEMAIDRLVQEHGIKNKQNG